MAAKTIGTHRNFYILNSNNKRGKMLEMEAERRKLVGRVLEISQDQEFHTFSAFCILYFSRSSGRNREDGASSRGPGVSQI